MKSLRVGLLLGTLAVTACVSRRDAPPPQQPPSRAPIVTPTPTPPPPPPPAATDWRAMPLTPGAWSYRSEGGASLALFGPANSGALFAVRCDLGTRQVTLSRPGAATGNMMTIRSTESARNVPVSVRTDPMPAAVASLAARDRFLDAIVFSRGRFTVEVPGTGMLVVPAWPEPARVIEDCRG